MADILDFRRQFERQALTALADMSAEERAAYMRGWNDALRSERTLQRVHVLLSVCEWCGNTHRGACLDTGEP